MLSLRPTGIHIMPPQVGRQGFDLLGLFRPAMGGQLRCHVCNRFGWRKQADIDDAASLAAEYGIAALCGNQYTPEGVGWWP